MFTKRFFILSFAVVAIVAMGAFTAFAQDTGDVVPPYGMMGNGGRGAMTGVGPQAVWDDDTAPMYAAAAGALGIDVPTLTAELQSGKTLAQIAAELGLDPATITATVQATLQERLQEMVTAGLLTQAQADAHLAYSQQRWDDAPMLSGDCTGLGLLGTRRGGTGIGQASGSGVMGGQATRGGRMGGRS